MERKSFSVFAGPQVYMVGRQMESQDLALTMAGPAPQREDSKADAARALERAKAGDRAAFEELILCYERRVLMTAWRLLGSKEDAQDAAQEVFLRLFRHLHRVDPKRPLLPWLYRMTVNVCHDLNRKRRRRAEVDVEEVDPERLAVDPAREITRSDQKRMIAAAPTALPEKERAALVLRDIEGLSTSLSSEVWSSAPSRKRQPFTCAI